MPTEVQNIFQLNKHGLSLPIILSSICQPGKSVWCNASDSRTKSDVLVVNYEGKVKLAEKTVFELKKNIKKKCTR